MGGTYEQDVAALQDERILHYRDLVSCESPALRDLA